MTAGVDTSFGYHSDTPRGKYPDKHSQTLQRHHQLLWSKELPVGGRFDLAPEPKSYLAHRSRRGVFRLSSDAITTRLEGKASAVIRQIPASELPPYRGYRRKRSGVPWHPDRRKAGEQSGTRLSPPNRRPLRPDAGVHPASLS